MSSHKSFVLSTEVVRSLTILCKRFFYVPFFLWILPIYRVLKDTNFVVPKKKKTNGNIGFQFH